MPEYIALDVETASAEPGHICSVGLATGNGVAIRSIEQMIAPHHSLEEFKFTDIHGISREQAEAGISFAEWHRIFSEVYENRDVVFVAQNASFDYNQILRACQMYDLPMFPYPWVDTLKSARRALPELKKHGLATLVQHYGIPHLAHNAASDAHATMYVWNQIGDPEKDGYHRTASTKRKVKTFIPTEPERVPGIPMPRKDPEAKRAYDREWKKNNPDRVRAYAQKYYGAHSKEYKERAYQWRDRNPEEHASHQHRNKARRRALMENALCASCTPSLERATLAKWYGDKCLYCGGAFEDIEHFIPLSKGGMHCWNNLVPACKSCNTSKGGKFPWDWERWQGQLPQLRIHCNTDVSQNPPR